MLDDSILKLIQNSFSSSVQTIYIPTIDKTLRFRESALHEQKTVSKVVVANPDKQSVIYATTLAMIRNLCLDEIDVSKITEFDRLKILAFLFSMNFFSKRLTITCPKCRKSFHYSVMHGDILKGMDEIDTEDVIFKAKNRIGTIEVTLNFPNCVRYLDFLEVMDRIDDANNSKMMKSKKSVYDSMNTAFDNLEKIADSQDENDGKAVDANEVRIAEMIRKRKQGQKSEKKKQSENVVKEDGPFASYVTLLDAVDMYIKKIRYHVNGSEDDVEIDFTNYGFEDTEKILANFPTALFTDDESGTNLITFIHDSFKKKLNKAVPKIVCTNEQCSADLGSRLDLHDFFLFG